MPFTWEQIDKSWLLGNPINAPLDAVVAAFNRVEQEFGQSFFDSYKGPRGQFIVSLVLDMNTLLQEKENGNYMLPNPGEILTNIKQGNIFRSANIIRLSAHYVRNGCEVISEPELFIRETAKHPDMKVTCRGRNVFIEESAFSISERQHVIESVFDEVNNTLNSFKRSIWVTVQLLKDDVSREEILEVIDIAIEMGNDRSQPQKRTVDDIAEIVTFLSHDQAPKIVEVRPALCQAGLLVGPSAEVHLDVHVPFSDARVSKMLGKLSQLPNCSANLIVLDLSQSGDMNRLYNLTRDFLKPEDHRSISGVLLVASRRYVDRIIIEHRSLEHPDPYVRLPCIFKHLTDDFYTNNTTYLCRRLPQTPQ